MFRIRKLFFLVGIAFAPVAHAQSICLLCATDPTAAAAAATSLPLRIEIESALDFSTAAHTDAGSGSIKIDPATGARSVGGGLVALSGMALRGTVRLTGEPFRQVRIDMPQSVTMESTQGAKATISGFETDLPPNPTLNANGQLTFSFGGKMVVVGGAAGDFHGRLQITADYQ